MEADQSFDEDDVDEEEEEEEEEEDVKTSKKRPAPSLTPKSQVRFTPFELVQSYRWLQVMCFNMSFTEKNEIGSQRGWRRRWVSVVSHCYFVTRFAFSPPIITDLFCRDDEEADDDEEDDDDDEEEEEDIEESPVKARLFSGSSIVCI